LRIKINDNLVDVARTSINRRAKMSKNPNITTIPLREVPMDGLTKGHLPYRPVVLVVDDECAIADSLSEILKRSGYDTMTAYDGGSGLDAALLRPPDLLITDVVLPGMSGIELAITMRRVYPDCKVILFSGNAATSSMLETATRAGHNFLLLNKPVHPTEMLSRVSEYVRPRIETMTSRSQTVSA
jgi:DNA-binding response OmpR family regulator